MTSDEFLSGMRKEDRLHPIITIVVCYSEDIWDGPVCLKDMIVDMPEKIEKVFSDYKMNLVQIRDSGQYIFHNEDVKNLFEVSRMIYEEDEEVEGSKMCRALENLKESGRAEGRAEGELNKIKEQIQKKIAKGKTAEVIAEELEEEIIVIRKLIKEMNL